MSPQDQHWTVLLDKLNMTTYELINNHNISLHVSKDCHSQYLSLIWLWIHILYYSMWPSVNFSCKMFYFNTTGRICHLRTSIKHFLYLLIIPSKLILRYLCVSLGLITCQRKSGFLFSLMPFHPFIFWWNMLLHLQKVQALFFQWQLTLSKFWELQYAIEGNWSSLLSDL